MQFFAGMAPEANMQDMLGFSFIGLVILLTVINMHDIFGFAANGVKLLAVKYYNRYKFKTKKNAVVNQ